MGVRFSSRRAAEEAADSLHLSNTSGLHVFLWVNGGGPVCRVTSGKVAQMRMPKHVRAAARLEFTATVSDGVFARTEIMQWRLPADRKRSSCTLHISNCNIEYNGGIISLKAIEPLVRAQIRFRARVADKIKHLRAMDSLRKALDSLEKQQLEWAIMQAETAGLEKRELEEARVALRGVEKKMFLQKRAALIIGYAGRRWLASHLIECPVCLSEGECCTLMACNSSMMRMQIKACEHPEKLRLH